MKGIQVSLTGNERSRLIDAVINYTMSMSEGEETNALITEELNDGLGSAMFKLTKGLMGNQAYRHYNDKKQ